MPDVWMEGGRVNLYQHLIILATGLSISLRSKTSSGEPYLYWMIAFIVFP